jgi:hypothetical protein
VAHTGGETEYPNRARKTSDLQTQREMNINAQPNNMIDNRIENPSGPALLIRQASELAIRVIENIGNNVKGHSHEIDGKSPIKIKMAGDDAEYSADETNCGRREIQSRKKLRQTETDSPIEEKIDNSFELARFVGPVDRPRRF